MQFARQESPLMQSRVSRRDFIRHSLATGFGAVAAAQGLGAHREETPAQRPNIIFLLTDDQRWDTLGVSGNTIVQTPNLDALASDGVLFQNAFVTTAICCTSRASIFLGQWARRHAIHDFSTPFNQEQLELTYHHRLRNAGYRTGFIGKYGVGNKLPAEDFDYWKGIPGQPTYELTDEQGNYKHLTQLMGEQAIEFLEGCRDDQPFCLSISFKAPHVQDNDPRQFIYNPIYKDIFKDIEIPVPKTADPRYWESFPEFFKADNEARRRWEIRFSTPEKYQESVKGYYRLIYGVDVVIGKIREALIRKGFAGNTVILFSSDNGFYLGEHGLAGKWYGHEESIRVPLIYFDPRLPASLQNQKLEAMALNVDIAPTILDLAGLEVPEAMQGKSLRSLVHGETTEWRDEFFYEHLFDHPRIPKSEGIVTKRFKYLRYFEQDPVYEELYDLTNDPLEERNLAARDEYHPVLIELREKTDRYSNRSK